jgi:signal transduction histidine kinase
MQPDTLALIFFFYGLAFFSMGLAILLELGQCSDYRLRHALRPLAAFGLLHGFHEWLEMFILLGLVPLSSMHMLLYEGLRLMLLAFSFLSLAAFGSSLLAGNERERRLSLLVPLMMAAIWAFSLLLMRGRYSAPTVYIVVDVITRYTLAIPAAIVACAGLVVQQRRFRQAGMAEFGRDALWAAIAFFWYGVIGQTFTRASPLWPSNIVNQAMFYDIFGFPVQMLRAFAAVLVAIFVIRFLRSFEVEMRNQIEKLQATQLEESQRREALRGELLRRVVAAQESERQRIARELHDETGQSLTAIGLGLGGVTSAIHQDVEKASGQLKLIQGLVAQALNELQRLIADLRPSHLDDLGLPATLRWYANEVEKRTGLKVSVETHGEPQSLPGELKTTLFRIAQEALNNTVKHGHATHADVQLSFGGSSVSLKVSDDGTGFNVNRLGSATRPSWGLLGMRERASLLGGSLDIYSSMGEGTKIQVKIPYTMSYEDGRDGNTRATGG